MPSETKAGAKLGPRLAKIVADAHAYSLARSGPHRRRLVMQLQDDFFKLTGTEAQATLGPLFRRLADDPQAPEWARSTFGFLADGLGQWQTILGSQVGGVILGQGVGALVTNELEPVIASILAANPSMILPATTAANAAALGLIDYGHAEREAAFNGINSERFAQLVRLAQSGPGVPDILTLFRRGQIEAEKASRALQQAGIADEWVVDVVSLLRQPLSPNVLADAVVRGILTQADAAKQAEWSGVYEHDFDTLVRDTGEAPALQTLLEAYRRGIIDTPRLEHGIITGRLRNEWIDVAKALRFEPPGPADAIRAAVQNHLTLDAAKAKAEEAGLNPADFEWLYETAGEPIAVGEALSLWNRGEIGQGEVEQAVRESRLKNKYLPAVLRLRRHLLPQRTVVAIYRAGAFTLAQATNRLADLGVTGEDAAALLAEASHGRTSHHRNLAETQILELYADHALNATDTHASLVALGYDDHEIEEILALADLRAARKLQQAVINVIRSRYVSRHVTEEQAKTALTAAGVLEVEQAHLLGLWTLERDTTVRLPTAAELSSATKKGVIDGPTWAARIVELGYHPDDVGIIAAAHNVNLGA